MGLSLKLLGAFTVQRQSATAPKLRRKTRSVLAYLAVTRQPYSRQHLAALFCQSAADPTHTVRLILSRLRRSLGQEILIADRTAVSLNTHHLHIDLTAFNQVLSQSNLQAIPTRQLEQALTLYRGEFLEGLHLPDAPEFEMWLLGQRSHWRQLYGSVL